MIFKAITGPDRKLQLNWERVYLYCARWKPGTPLEISITRRKPKTSDPMRKLYFGHVLPSYGNHLGYDADEHMLLHRQLKIVWHKCEPDNKGIYLNVPRMFANDAATDVSIKRRFLNMSA